MGEKHCDSRCPNIKQAINYHNVVINPLHAEVFLEKMYLQFISYIHNEISQVVEIVPHVRQELTYST